MDKDYYSDYIDEDIINKINDEIKHRVFKRENELDEKEDIQRKKNILIKVLQELTELPKEEIQKIADEEYKEYKHKVKQKKTLEYINQSQKQTNRNTLRIVSRIIIALVVSIISFLYIKKVIINSIDKKKQHQITIKRNKEKDKKIIYEKKYEKLFKAYNDGVIETVKFLINQGAHINAINKKNQTLLILSVYDNNKDLIKFLINKKANVNVKDSYGNTALGYAIERGRYFEIIKMLIDNNASIYSINHNGYNALVLAILNRRKKVTKYLLLHGALLNLLVEDKEFTPELLLKIAKYSSKMIKYLMVGEISKKSMVNEITYTMNKAARDGEVDVVKIFLKYGADVTKRDNFGSTALTYAAYGGNAKVGELLLNAGAYINVKGKYDYTPLLSAVIANNPAFVKMLLDRGADYTITANDNEKATPLYYAECTGYYEVARLLRKAGAKK